MGEAKQPNQEQTSQRDGNDPEELAGKASQILRMMEQLARISSTSGDATAIENGQRKEHKFWKTQPVLQTTSPSEEQPPAPSSPPDGPIEPAKEPEAIRKEPYPLPAEFAWCEIDVDDAIHKSELYQLLSQNYVEDIESLFRFDYPAAFLQWALQAPGWRREWHVGVRVVETGKLVAFISAIPARFHVRHAEMDAVEVNFLCIHKRLRSKRLAPLMIKEVTRRVHLHGIFQALYTAGVVLPGVLAKARYYHRPIDYRKLVEVGFAAVPLGSTLEQMVLRHHLPKRHHLTGLRPMHETDVPRVTEMLRDYLGKFALHPLPSEEEVRHWLLPRPDLLYSYVLEERAEEEENEKEKEKRSDPNSNHNNTLTAMISFYSLPSSVMGNANHSHLKVAYLFYYAVQSDAQLEKLVHAALVIARDLGFDVFNCVEIMDNQVFLKELRFGEGDGHLHYYLYNWQTSPFRPEETAIVML